MPRSSFIVTESRCGQPPADFFKWPLSIRQQIIRTICTPGIRHMLMDRLDETNGKLVALTAERMFVAQRSLQATQMFLECGDAHPTSYGCYRPNDLPSVRAALAIVNPIINALNGVEAERAAA